MKKITFILLVLLTTGTAFGQTDATAIAAADIVSPLTITKTTDFSFGKVTNSGGTVIIGTDNSASGTASRVGTALPTAAAFTVNAAATYVYTVTLPEKVVLTNQTGTGGETMEITALEHNSTEEGIGGDEVFNVGGTLTVAAGQKVGYYKGNLVVSVAYE